MQSDEENQSQKLLNFYNESEFQRKTIDDVLMYLCGWTFPTILKKCGIKTDMKTFSGNRNHTIRWV
jgi:hypothetical protein